MDMPKMKSTTSKSKRRPKTDEKKKSSQCVVCNAVYGADTDLKNREDWYQCRWCCKWAHESCGNVDFRYFECLNCWESD